MPGHALAARFSLDADHFQAGRGYFDKGGDCIWVYLSCPFCSQLGELLMGSSGTWPSRGL